MTLSEIERACGLPRNSLGAEKPLAGTEGWDSLAALSFLTFLDSLGIPPKADDILKAQTGADLVTMASGGKERQAGRGRA